MTGSAAFARIKAEVLDLVSRIPPGRVAVHKDIGGYLTVQPRHVAYILATLDEVEREGVAWWRVVADGGAVGRHLRRDDQMARLRADGIVLSGVGIVQDLTVRKLADMAALKVMPVRPPDEPSPPPLPPAPSRARGSKGRPTSTI